MHLSVQSRVTVFLVLLVVFGLNIAFWVQDTGSRHCASVGHWQDFEWRSELAECSLHDFTITDVVTCLHSKRVAFIGDDSQMKQLFFFFAKFIAKVPHIVKKDDKHLAVKDEASGIIMDFYQRDTVDEGVEHLYQQWKLTGAPQLVLHNGCSWILGRRHTMSEVLSQTTTNITRLVGSQNDILNIYKASQIYWLPQDNVQDKKLWGSGRKSTNKHIFACNEAIRHAYLRSEVQYMEPLVTLMTGKRHDSMDVLSFQNLTLKAKLDVVLSAYCSPLLPDHKLSPTCCISPQPSQLLLVVMALSVAIYLGAHMIVATNTLKGLRPFIQASKQTGVIPFSDQRLSVIGQVTSSICHLLTILLFIYICDRTFLFVKTDKIASLPIFVLLLLCSMLAGLFTLTEPEEFGFFDDQQVEEFKGLAMMFMLSYLYMSSITQQGIFPQAIHQFSVGLYLFTDAYGCYANARHTKGYRASQLIKKLVYANLFPFILGQFLGTPYYVYYLAPLLSFSSVFTYLIISTHPKMTDFSNRTYAIIIKLLLVAMVLWIVPPIYSLFRLKHYEWNKMCTLFDNTKFAPLFGLIVGLVVCKAKEAEWSLYNLSLRAQVVFKLVTSSGLIFAMVLMLIISHTGISYVIFLALVMLRNFHSSFQKYSSNLLQIAGILSYELFLVHFHIWTAYRGSALLLMTPEIELVNFLLASLVLVLVSDYLNSAIGSLLQLCCS